MRIGIDIDNTLTEVQNELNIAAYNYAKSLGKNIDKSKSIFEDINNDGNFYKEKFGFSYEELKYFLKNIQEEIINKATPRENAIKCIEKLKEDGHEIYIITARDSEFHDDPYKLSKNWLNKNGIKFDKLIVNARKKAPICKEEKIDIFIDDQLSNCIEISHLGIKTIRISDKPIDYENIINCKNWEEIYTCILKWSYMDENN